MKPEDAGKTFGGQCAELCGSGHRLMTFEVRALTQADFDAWLQEHIDQANATPPPPASGEPPGEQLTTGARLLRCRPTLRSAPSRQRSDAA